MIGMRTTLGLSCVFVLLVGTSAVAQIGGHPADTSVVNGTLSLWEGECFDDYVFSGKPGQILWSDIDSSWYVKQDGNPGLLPGFCLQVIDRYQEVVCWSAGQSIGHLIGIEFGWNPANVCVLPEAGNYTLRVAVNDYSCGYRPVTCDELVSADSRSQEIQTLAVRALALEPLALGIELPGLGIPDRPAPDLEAQQLPPNGYFELDELPYLLNVSLRDQAREGSIFTAAYGSKNKFPKP
jgi:hypothetical protein